MVEEAARFSGKNLLSRRHGLNLLTLNGLQRSFQRSIQEITRPRSTWPTVQTTNDSIRQKSIDKGFTFSDFKKAADNARSGGAGIKTYLLFKPLFLTEREALLTWRSRFGPLLELLI